MHNNFESFDNLELQARKISAIQERVTLVSSHMYKQFLEYQQSSINTSEAFLKIIANMEQVTGLLKQSFQARGVSSSNIYFEVDPTQTVATINILWRQISFTNRFNTKPQALYRGPSIPPVFVGRIMALSGNFFEMTKGIKDEEQMPKLLEHEVASLYLPGEKAQSALIKIRHIGNQEHAINQVDAPREFLLKVIETICGGGIYHEEGTKKNPLILGG